MNIRNNSVRPNSAAGSSGGYPLVSPQYGRRGSTESVDSIQLQFAANNLLRDLGYENLYRIGHLIRRVSLLKEQYLYQQDDEVQNIYFPESAVISEFQIAEDGRTIEVAMTGSEGAVGIAAAFGAPRAANCIQVCLPGTALFVARDVLEREVATDSRLNFRLHAYVNGQIRNLSQKVVCNTFHSVEQRFCTWLLALQRRSRREKFRITHEHVARALGVHRPSVTCIAQSLRERKLIDYGRARLVIRDRVGLEHLACRCSSDTAPLRTNHRS